MTLEIIDFKIPKGFQLCGFNSLSNNFKRNFLLKYDSDRHLYSVSFLFSSIEIDNLTKFKFSFPSSIINPLNVEKYRKGIKFDNI